MTVWVVLGLLGIAVLFGVWRYLRGGSLAERRELREEMRRIQGRDGRPADVALPPADRAELPGLLSRYGGTDGLGGGGLDGGNG
ncbi:hypothetical protein [Actinophytocola sp.]|uniref:hypothetical protein n=1 Tax=Actinophytocola sp. TaxID=1872138 RepID=UPI002D80E9D7|nr:hypothetical protein [Actinophytocola sp.]HET9142827.1 hypothetical protein [Actinophytocola sp.]